MKPKKSHYIQDLILEGEHEHQDFKYQITDARKIARSIAAFANNSGGHLLIGVKDNGNWHVYYRVADENMLASRLHERIMSAETAIEETRTAETISYSEREQVLLDYLRNHGGITLEGYMRLAHISEESATRIVVALHSMGVVDLQYHDGQCLIVGSL